MTSVGAKPDPGTESFVRVCRLADLGPGDRRIIDLGGRSIGVFNVNGHLYAVRNACPHQGAALCRGTVGGAMLPSAPGVYEYGLDGQVLRCPWHGWAFDLTTGESLFGVSKTRVKTYATRVIRGWVEIHSPTAPGAVEAAKQ